jgi:hypothetical protein
VSVEDWADLLEKYRQWFAEAVSVDEVAGYAELTTPFLDRHNDHIQIYALRTQDGFHLTDDGHALGELENSGVEYSKGQRKDILETILNGFRVSRDSRDALIVDSSADDVGARLHDLIQAVLAVDDMYVLARTRVRSLFFEDVSRFLAESSIVFRERERLRGKSGWPQPVNFFMPATDDLPARMLQAVGTPTKQVVEREIFLLEDVRQAYEGDIRSFALLNDQAAPIPEESFHAFEEYSIRVEPWSSRETIRSDLVTVG